MSPACAASSGVAARACGPSSVTRSASVSGPRELLITTLYPFLTARRASWLPICPAPMSPIVFIPSPRCPSLAPARNQWTDTVAPRLSAGCRGRRRLGHESAAFDHGDDVSKVPDVARRVAGEHDEIGKLPFLHRADLVLHTDDPGADARRSRD